MISRTQGNYLFQNKMVMTAILALLALCSVAANALDCDTDGGPKNSLSYQDRDDRCEGIKPNLGRFGEVLMLLGVATTRFTATTENRPEAASTMTLIANDPGCRSGSNSSRFSTHSPINNSRNVSVLVRRKQSDRPYYILNELDWPWHRDSINSYRWPADVLRGIPDQYPEFTINDLVALVETEDCEYIGNMEVKNLAQVVVPVMLHPEGVTNIERAMEGKYTFTFFTSNRAYVDVKLYNFESNSSASIDLGSRSTSPRVPFSFSWDPPVDAEPGIYEIRVNACFGCQLSDKESLGEDFPEQRYRFVHR